MSGFEGWVPIGLAWENGCPRLDWCYLGGIRFTDPFFENTMQRAMMHPFRVLFRQQTSIDILQELAASRPGILPTGFIFHMSRCGSTLIGQMLAAADENVVISEGWPIESVINADARHPAVTSDQRMRWLRGMLHALGQPRGGREHRFFVKFDAPQTIDLPLVRAAFPDVPWVYLYRNPIEVLVSQTRHRASWTMPGIVPIRGVQLSPAAFADHEAYMADVMRVICESALRCTSDTHGLLLNYDELPGALFTKLSRHFRCNWSDEEVTLMHQAGTRDAKLPTRPFSPDSQSKREEAGERLREICERFLGDVYRSLEERRTLS